MPRRYRTPAACEPPGGPDDFRGVSVKLHVLERTQWVPVPVAETFAFFADAPNLGEITPPWLHFRIVTPLPIAMAAGALIDYPLRLHGLAVHWRTRSPCGRSLRGSSTIGAAASRSRSDGNNPGQWPRLLPMRSPSHTPHPAHVR